MPTHSTYSSSVDIATGAVLNYGFDFYLNGVIPLEIERLWFSDSDFSGRLGYGVPTIPRACSLPLGYPYNGIR